MTTNWRKDPKYHRMDPSPWEQHRRMTNAGVVRWRQRWVHTFNGHEIVRQMGTLDWRPISDDELAELLFIDSLCFLLAG